MYIKSQKFSIPPTTDRQYRYSGGLLEVLDDIPKHDILTAGFPCQPFSIAGVSKYNSLGTKHGFSHPTQGTLFFDLVKIIQQKRPQAFLLENVKNLISHDQGNTFKTILWTLEQDLGYTVYYQILDASLIVPQHRSRIFIVGFAQPLSFSFPNIPNHHPKIKDILEPVVDPKYTLTDHLWKYLQDYATKHKAKGNGFGYSLVDLESISRTLSARYYKDGSEILIGQTGKNPRRLTPKECANLMGFPQDFKIPVSDSQAYRQFGNAVVPPLVAHIASAMILCLEKKTID